MGSVPGVPRLWGCGLAPLCTDAHDSGEQCWGYSEARGACRPALGTQHQNVLKPAAALNTQEHDAEAGQGLCRGRDGRPRGGENLGRALNVHTDVTVCSAVGAAATVLPKKN